MHKILEMHVDFRQDSAYIFITKTCPLNTLGIFSEVKILEFSDEKKNDVFLIFGQHSDCGYTLETPRRGGSNQYLQSTVFESKLCPRMRKPAVTTQLISAFVFATMKVLFLFYLYPKFQTSSFMLSMYNLVRVGPGRKPKLLVFSCTGTIKRKRKVAI